eukprot:scaffold586_cov155-Amphora_coffeaeformis.AAC.30
MGPNFGESLHKITKTSGIQFPTTQRTIEATARGDTEAREIDFNDDSAWDLSFRVQLTLQRATSYNLGFSVQLRIRRVTSIFVERNCNFPPLLPDDGSKDLHKTIGIQSCQTKFYSTLAYGKSR